MILLAIDPGTTESGWVLYDTETGAVRDSGVEDNLSLLDWLGITAGRGFDQIAIEMIASYGMPVGAEVFETCVWIGRFIEAVNVPHTKVYRRDVKLLLCGTAKAKDANIRQALIDRYGGKDAAIGRKASPGPLYGIKSHMWPALAVAVAWVEMDKTTELEA